MSKSALLIASRRIFFKMKDYCRTLDTQVTENRMLLNTVALLLFKSWFEIYLYLKSVWCEKYVCDIYGTKFDYLFSNMYLELSVFFF